jgi:hypothetical protein
MMKDLTNEELVAKTHKIASSMSYYNAAEGNWSQERVQREACAAELQEALVEMRARGIEFENRGYLL